MYTKSPIHSSVVDVDGDEFFEYNIRETCMGEIKRFILTNGYGPPDLCLALNPSDISVGNGLPSEMVDHLYEQCGMLNRLKDRSWGSFWSAAEYFPAMGVVIVVATIFTMG